MQSVVHKAYPEFEGNHCLPKVNSDKVHEPANLESQGYLHQATDGSVE